MILVLRDPRSKDAVEDLCRILDELPRNIITSVESSTLSRPSPFLVRDSNSLEKTEARAKIINALWDGDLTFDELKEKSGISRSTLSNGLRQLGKEGLVRSYFDVSAKQKRWRLNKREAITLAAISISTMDPKPTGGPYRIMRYRGRFGIPRTVSLTKRGGQILIKLREIMKSSEGRPLELDQMIDEALWDKLRSVATVAELPEETLAWDLAKADQKQQGGDGNCPRCRSGMMKEIKPSSFWHCPSCGANRAGSWKPELLPTG
jgi:DNA-binding transcriptional ArsR family regulator